MSDYLLYNGHFHKNSDPLITANNRGLRYGDGLFETIKWVNGTIQLGPWHFERLFNGLQLLQFELPAYFTAQWLTGQVETLCKKNSGRFYETLHKKEVTDNAKMIKSFDTQNDAF